jgi:hypothetical protein
MAGTNKGKRVKVHCRSITTCILLAAGAALPTRVALALEVLNEEPAEEIDGP